ncbi:hypothetical protein HP15_p187g144 (plasmid) [Marinobacter adhaerens HP15]|uniref:Uncharacterized protein n=1 Tax=Marinobacter adhaerens (strain DSM 23420 / HP15) TaxID=225937 RepID=E4PSA7_MARAH|nr:hypothetical protein HP15_p187g144 [Marinobacter adhaerens HP15]
MQLVFYFLDKPKREIGLERSQPGKSSRKPGRLAPCCVSISYDDHNQRYTGYIIRWILDYSV